MDGLDKEAKAIDAWRDDDEVVEFEFAPGVRLKRAANFADGGLFVDEGVLRDECGVFSRRILTHNAGRVTLTNRRLILTPASWWPWPKSLPWLKPLMLDLRNVTEVATTSRWSGFRVFGLPRRGLLLRLANGRAYSIYVADPDSWERDILSAIPDDHQANATNA